MSFHKIQIIQSLGGATNASEKLPIPESASFYSPCVRISAQAFDAAHQERVGSAHTIGVIIYRWQGSSASISAPTVLGMCLRLRLGLGEFFRALFS
jgi:hypothetical protein